MAGRLASQARGPSEAQFRAAYGTEERCRAVVEKLRRPEGFACPLRGGREGKWLSTRPGVQCRACRHQVSPTAGTISHATELPLTAWFLAMWLVATAKNGISSVELGRRLGIKQTNAWALTRSGWTAGSRWTTPTWAATARASGGEARPASNPSSRRCRPPTTGARGR